MKPAPGQQSLFGPPPSAREQYSDEPGDCFECGGRGKREEQRTYGSGRITIRRKCRQCGGTGKRPAVKLNPTVESQDAPRLRAKLLRLRDAMGTEWRSAAWLKRVAGDRYSARLGELKDAGIPHETRRKEDCGWEYEFRLIGSPTNGLMGDGRGEAR